MKIISPEDVIYKAIKRHAGLSEWDYNGIQAEVKAITKALDKAGFIIRTKDFDPSKWDHF